ncbi:type I restriction enzyme, S subunit [Gammaproteobacteria bacterium]
MEKWRDYKLGDLLEIKHGFAFLGEYFANAGTHIVLTPGNFFDEGGFKHKGDKEKWYRGPIPADYVLNEGDLIVAMTEQAEGLLGSSAIVPCRALYLHNQRLGLVQLRDTNQTDKDFVYYLFNSKPVRQQIRGSASGTKIRHTAPSRIAEVKVSIPSLPIQQRIAGILSAYDDLIENSQRRINILEKMARSLYREWFVHFRFPGHENHPRVASAVGEIPAGWEVRKLAEFVTTKYGYTESTNTEPVGPKYLRGMDINKSSFIDWSEVPYCPIAHKDYGVYRLRVGDVVVIRMADPGKVGIVEQEVDAVFASYLIRVAPKDNRLSPYFLFYLMESAEYYAYITGASTGTTRKSASAGVIADYQFVLPPQQLVVLFEKRVSEIRSLLTALLKQTVNLRRTRDLLLPRLLSGQIDVGSS